MNFITTKEDELMHLVKTVLTVILDDDSIPTWSMGSEQYYRKLTDHVFRNDAELIEKIKEITAMTRASYRSYPEFSNLQALVSCERSPEDDDDTGVDDICCVCLQPLCNTWQKVIRLRTIDNDPNKCAHKLHKTCAMHVHLDEDGDLHCPLCRETVHQLPRQWIDQESKIPKF